MLTFPFTLRFTVWAGLIWIIILGFPALRLLWLALALNFRIVITLFRGVLRFLLTLMAFLPTTSWTFLAIDTIFLLIFFIIFLIFKFFPNNFLRLFIIVTTKSHSSHIIYIFLLDQVFWIVHNHLLRASHTSSTILALFVLLLIRLTFGLSINWIFCI